MTLFKFKSAVKKGNSITVRNCKFIISIAFSILILYNTVKVSISYIYYNIDTIGFIEAFCENTDKPELQCNGKCHLEKISKTENQKDKQALQIIDFKDLLLINHKATTLSFHSKKSHQKASFNYVNFYNYKYLKSSFHPPTV